MADVVEEVVAKVVEPIGYVIRRPTAAEKGDLLLFVTRPQAGPFGTAGTGIFAIDSISEDNWDVIRCTSAAGPVIFNKELPFLVVPRSLTCPVTTKDLAEIQKQEKKDWEEAYGTEDETGMGAAVEVMDSGRVRQNSQGYL